MSHQSTDTPQYHETEGDGLSSPTSSDTDSYTAPPGVTQNQAPTFSCEVHGCTQTFAKRYQLKAHYERHHRDIHRKYECKAQDCPNPNPVFGSPSDLQRHNKSLHTPNAKCHPCPTCGEQFTRKDNCKSHMKTCRSKEGSQARSETRQSTPLDPVPEEAGPSASSSRLTAWQSTSPSPDPVAMIHSHVQLPGEPSSASRLETNYGSTNTGQTQSTLPYRDNAPATAQWGIDPAPQDSYTSGQPVVQYVSDPYTLQQPGYYGPSHPTMMNPRTAYTFPPGDLEATTLAAGHSRQTDPGWMDRHYSHAAGPFASSQSSYGPSIPDAQGLIDNEAVLEEHHGYTALWVSKNTKPHKYK